MRKAVLAEWILRCVTAPGRAAAIVGDLLESEAVLSSSAFWAAVARIFIALSWRTALGLVLAFSAAIKSFAYFQTAIFGIALTPSHRAPAGWINLLAILSSVGVFLWFLVPYSALRYGLRDRLTQFVSVSALLVTAVIFFWWEPGFPEVSGLAAVAGLMVWMRQRDRRRAAAVAALTVCAGILFGVATVALDTFYTRVLVPGTLVGNRVMMAHPSLAWVALTLLILSALSTAKVCAIAHNWQVKEAQVDLHQRS